MSDFEKTEKIFCGSGWEISNQWGVINNFEIEVDKLPAPDQFGKVYLTMKRRKELGKHKQTHYIQVNDYRTREKLNAKPKTEPSTQGFFDDKESSF